MRKAVTYALVGLLAFVAVFCLLLLGGLIVMLVWNIGAVPLIAACGGTVSKIGFWTAFFVNMAVNIISRIFRGSSTDTK